MKKINLKTFNECLENDKYLSDVEKITAAANKAGISGTPMFFVNGEKVSSSWSAIEEAITNN